MGGIYGCGCKDIIYTDFLILLIPTPSCICSFLQQHLYFSFFLRFSSLIQYFFVIKFNV